MAPYFGDAPTLGLYPIFFTLDGVFFPFSLPLGLREVKRGKTSKLSTASQPPSWMRNAWKNFYYSSKMKRNNCYKPSEQSSILCMDGSHLFLCTSPRNCRSSRCRRAVCLLSGSLSLSLCVRPSRARPALIFSCDLQFPSSSLLVVLLWLWRSSSGRFA